MTLVGNERLLTDHGVIITMDVARTLESWKAQGKSVVLAAVRSSDIDSAVVGTWALLAIAAVSDPVRPEAAGVVQALQRRGMDVWMISGDNETTARAVAAMVGIPPCNVLAGVLPEQKATKITYLQQSQTRHMGTRPSLLGRWRGQRQGQGQYHHQGPTTTTRSRQRSKVAMVGDGVNDSPALTVADVGIAVGTGSDVAISSAEFVLMTSDLTTVLVLLQLAQVVFRRIKFNFAWALVYNMIALPIAAGALYVFESHGRHIRLDPVWAALAMALSSISVVSSSLALRCGIPWVGFRRGDVLRGTKGGMGSGVVERG